jgi:hypothetical protein
MDASGFSGSPFSADLRASVGPLPGARKIRESFSEHVWVRSRRSSPYEQYHTDNVRKFTSFSNYGLTIP